MNRQESYKTLRYVRETRYVCSSTGIGTTTPYNIYRYNTTKVHDSVAVCKCQGRGGAAQGRAGVGTCTGTRVPNTYIMILTAQGGKGDKGDVHHQSTTTNT